MTSRATNEDAAALALRALAATLNEPRRAERFLALTGLDADQLRARLGEPSLLGAVIAFLESHEPDLVAVANDIGSSPVALIEAGRSL
ncbi:DUF3572 family protein [Sphingomonas sp.]|uniref:DUF3572 family protein n=1 Tax=Sphingomonas sp. TaxID=28214 RepID=UPI003752F24D